MMDVTNPVEDGCCTMSECVFSCLRESYGPFADNLDDKELFKAAASVLSIPPLISVLRVNTMKDNISSAKQYLQTVLNRQQDGNFRVDLHNKIPDILTVSSCKDQMEIFPVTKEVIVGELCGIAVLRGADVFAPGVLGAPVGMKQNDVVSVYADLDGQCRKGFTQTYNGRKYFVGNGIAVLSRKELFNDSVPHGVAIKMTSSLLPLPSFDELNSDLLFAQNLPSVLVGHDLEPANGDIILDMCAAPGGKTTHIATLLQNKGIVIAIDKSKSKMEKLKRNCKQQNLTCVQCYSFDSTKLCQSQAEWHSSNPVPPFPPDSFDKVLLDPPCSALGQRPQLQCNMTSSELQSFPVYQRKLLQQAIKLLKPGGILIYSTCTLTVSENENQVAWILKNFPEVRLMPQTIHIGLSGITGHNLDEESCRLVQRFDPCIIAMRQKMNKINEKLSVDEDTIGFFIAKFKKENNTTA